MQYQPLMMTSGQINITQPQAYSDKMMQVVPVALLLRLAHVLPQVLKEAGQSSEEPLQWRYEEVKRYWIQQALAGICHLFR